MANTYIALLILCTEWTECYAFSVVVRIGTPPPPHTQASVAPSFGSGGITRLAGEGVGGPNSDEGTDTVLL
jgi:hypothetical protein